MLTVIFWIVLCAITWKLLRMAISVELRLWRSIAIIAIFICVCNILVIRQTYRGKPVREISATANLKLVSPTTKTKLIPSESGTYLDKHQDQSLTGIINPFASVGEGTEELPKFSNLVIKNPLFQTVHNLDSFFTEDKASLLGKRKKDLKRRLVCIGVPTVYRDQKSYLVDTIKQLVNNLNAEEKTKVIIVIFIADLTQVYRDMVKTNLAREFAGPISDGLIKVISAPQSYYPNLNNIPRLYGDQSDRVTWRSKQCLDYSFLHYYCADLADYFIQLEDDIVTNKNYFSQVEKFIEKHRQAQWSTLEFGDTGMIIGLTYRSQHLRSLAKFARGYFWTMPVDWMVLRFNEIFLYGNVHRQNFTIKPPLFKHIGKFSSLKGKVYLETNPKATKVFVSAGGHYAKNDIMTAYKQKGIYWGNNLVDGAYLQIELIKPAYLARIAFTSGSTSNPLDSFLNTSLYVSNVVGPCEKNLILLGQYNSTVVDYKWDAFKSVSCVRLTMDKLRVDSRGKPRWLIISEISLFDR